MTQEKERRGFEDLECYALALQVVKQAYGLAKRLPEIEKYNLAAQVRRSAASVTLNIAEGYGRYHYLDSLRFYYIARGSLTETLSAFVTCEAVGYLVSNELVLLRNLVHSALRSLNGYIGYVRKQQRGQNEYGNQLLREDQPLYHITLELPPDDE
ncbi:MAG: four helix bundle protein [Anaerolineae bacterium]|nr:four helix bundle protein [Anaerolineae bacterium]